MRALWTEVQGLNARLAALACKPHAPRQEVLGRYLSEPPTVCGMARATASSRGMSPKMMISSCCADATLSEDCLRGGENDVRDERNAAIRAH